MADQGADAVMMGVGLPGWPPTALLFVPADRAARYLPTAEATGARAVILDLEDGVSPGAKAAARSAVDEVASDPQRIVLLVRINAESTPWHQMDLELVARVRPAAIVVPKAEAPGRIRAIRDEVRSRAGIGIPIIALIETPRGLIAAGDVARVGGVVGLALGGEDLTSSLGAARTRAGRELLLARQMLLLAARAANVWAFDTICPEVPAGRWSFSEATAAKRAGYDGKLAIHPSQVRVFHDAFRPTDDEAARARSIVRAFDEAVAAGAGVTTVDGRMVDLPIADRARQVLRILEVSQLPTATEQKGP